MTENETFVARFRRLDRIGAVLDAFARVSGARIPFGPAWTIAQRCDGSSPLASERDAYASALRSATGCSAQQAAASTSSHFARHALGVFNHRGYARIDAGWVKGKIDVVDETGQWTPARGGLLLTWHMPEYHLMLSALGLMGAKVFPLVEPPELPAERAALAPYLERLHRNTERHFAGGRYIFLSDRAQARAAANAQLKSGALVAALVDNHDDRKTNGRATVLIGPRRLRPRAGLLRDALAAGVPIVSAAIAFDPGAARYRVYLRSLPTHALEQTLDAHFAHLRQLMRATPDIWDGWRWYEQLEND